MTRDSAKETSDRAKKTAAQCRHYAMCKIDYLDTGLCPSGPEKHYVAYYPQGRMDLYDALTSGQIPVTEALLDIAETCTLCGICDEQCHFVTGLRPVEVMRALKERVAEHIKNGGAILRPETNAELESLREIVGADWAAGDPAILLTYANDPFPLTGPRMPRFVVLPGSTAEVAAVVKWARGRGIPYAVRGNGGSVYGAVFSEGIVLDMNRMKDIALDADNWSATIGAGVTSFELQREARKSGFRVNAAEPAATVCGNLICTGIFSTWSHAYGLGADNVIDMEFVERDGRIFRLSDPDAPNVFTYQHAVRPAPGICTRAVIRLHPRTEDEEGLIVPFEGFEEAVLFARELGVRRIGLAAAVLGPHYIATFLSPARETADKLKTLLPDALGFRYGVFVVATGSGAMPS